VALVERVCDRADVFDIQVDDTECFFANDILVHNCIIDDPVRSRADAESEIVRENTWNWFTTDLTTRLRPGGRTVLIQTRWHVDDLAGRILETQRDKWRVVNLPATALEDDPLGRKPGELLWMDDPDYPYGELLRKAKAEAETSGAMRDWHALYEQQPTNGTGGIFSGTPALIDVAPKLDGRIVRAWDFAATAQVGTRNPDWTVGVKMAREDNGRIVVLDEFRMRGGPDDVAAAVERVARADGPRVRISIPQDPGQAGKSQALYFVRRLAGFMVESSPETGDKATRAMPFASQWNAGNVVMLRAPWNDGYAEELTSFPGFSKDDRVDASSRAFNTLTAAPAPTKRVKMNIMGR
jgi:predicted phage terminase large subunit-like protein